MRNKSKKIILLVSVLMTLVGCGEAAEESSVESTPEITQPVVTPLDWETPVIELGAENALSEKIKDYVTVSDDRYDEYTLESNVDLLSPGEYEIRISGYDEVYTFPVIVKDSTCPEMELLLGYDIVAPGSTVSVDAVFASTSDNDPEYVHGFYGLEAMTEEDLPLPESEDISENIADDTSEDISYEQRENSGMALEEISESITLPEEEGLYLVNAAVLDRSGNLATAPVYFTVDGTGPQIKLRKTKISLYTDQTYDFDKGVTLEDNVFSAEECTYRIDEEELNTLYSGLQSEQTGTYKVTYYAEDPLGNTTEKTVTVTVAERPAPQENSTPQTDNSIPQAGVETQNTPPASTDAYYDLAMAQAAFAAVNEYRTNNGVAALTWNDTLYENGKVRGAEIVTSFSHTRPNGQTCFTAVTVSYKTAGENIAYGYTTAQSVANGWWNSAGHQANILNASFSQGAIACYYSNGTYYWVNLFTG